MLFELILTYPRLTALLIVIALNWIAAVILLRASRRHPEIVSLTERARTAIVLALTVTLAAPLLINVQFDFPWLDRGALVWAGYAVTIMAGLPALVWLVTYLRGGFGGDE